ncbi:hypothetical protein CcaCcLH18_06051 [Colletotrichum camelliae]|nr:hypothetical protein CcaCcLH18_06051 [Colletotrichum camelliae]
MDTYRHNTILPMSIMCIHCQAIPLDDDQLGSHMTVTADGSKHLDFESDCESLVIPIDWQFEFDWPSLEQFNARLQRFYCPICRWIKDALIEIHADRMFELHEIKGFVKVSLSYAWGWSRGAARRGLQGLVMNAQFLSEQRNLIKSLSVEFRITSSRVISTCTSSDTLGAQPVASWLSLDDPITYLDPEYIQWMDEKLSICETHTQACHPMARENFIPDRLIDVSNDALKIVPKSEIWQRPETSDPRYAALSYCWGKKEDALAQAKLTTANMAQRLQSFDFSELTIPIQESVMVTRALGLRYLWVDALCITGSDWAVQCAIMDKIYRNAHVTICALGSASCRQGFLQKRAKMTLPFQSRLHPSITGSFAVDQPVIRETGHCLDPWSMDYDVAESNWDDRGWTFQENVLSTRMLLFGKRSVHFSCSEFHVSKQCRHWAGSESFQFPSATHMEYDRVELYDRWSSRLVTSYTDRTKTLTVGTDVLPAFAGTARLF